MTDEIGSPLLQRLLTARDVHDERLATLEETNSFITAVTEATVTIGAEWVQIGGLVLGPQNYQIAVPDLMLAEDGGGIDVHRNGRYFMALNCQLSNPTATGWFEPAVQPIGVCTPIWPTDTQVGHDGGVIPAEIFAYPGITPGKATHVECPCLDGDVLTGFGKFSTADGLGTIDVTAILYAIRIGD